MREPEVSVVMGVFNGAESLPATLESVMVQQGCEFEFIVVDDGSTDTSGTILDDWAARDPRLRVIHQANTGLTRALERGCHAARGPFIARQDCGDRSLPGRLASQAALLRADSRCVLVAGGARFLAPGGEPMYSLTRAGRALHEGLSFLKHGELQGPPHHGATMFRRSAYQQAGGYRMPFRVAQDIDLWLRLLEHGDCTGQDGVVYEARFDVDGISARRRGEQLRMAQLAIECAIARRSQRDEQALLAATASTHPASHAPSERRMRAQSLYFVGACVSRIDRRAARRYFREAFAADPLMVKSLVRLAFG